MESVHDIICDFDTEYNDAIFISNLKIWSKTVTKSLLYISLYNSKIILINKQFMEIAK